MTDENVYRSLDYDDNPALTARNANRLRFGQPELPARRQSYESHLASLPSGKETASKKKYHRKSQGKNEQSNALLDGGQGASPLSTRNNGKGSVNARNDSQNRNPTDSDASETDPPKPRSRLAGGKRLSWGTYRQQVADALGELGRWDASARLRSCGRFAQVWDCKNPTCELQNAGAIILTHCDSRACVQCSKQQARERVERLAPAFARLPEYHRARKGEAVDLLANSVLEHTQARDYWAMLADFVLTEKGNTEALALRYARLREKQTASENARKLAKWQCARAKENRWSYKLLTISPPWKPWDENDLSIERIRERISDCFARWARVWERINCGGLSGAIVSVEISDHGHIHLHAAIYAPFLVADFISKIAGCFIDLREAKPNLKYVREYGVDAAMQRAIREVVKYTVKSPSPKHDFVNGARRPVIHPELVARWVVATKSVQLGRLFGLARDAMKAENAAKKQDKERVADNDSRLCCPQCKSPLVGAPRMVATRELAKTLSEWEWTHRVRWRKSSGLSLTDVELVLQARAAVPDPLAMMRPRREVERPALAPSLAKLLDAERLGPSPVRGELLLPFGVAI